MMRPSLSEITGKSTNLPNRYALHAVEGWGKCLAKGTPVIMYDGTVRPVEEVKDGDLLMGPDSTPRTVSGLHHGAGPLFRVVPTKGDPYIVNANHILSLRVSRRSRGEFHRIINIPIQEYLQRSECFKRDALGWRVAVEWPKQEVPIDPYLFGCWLGDGTATKSDITTPEPEVVAAMQSYAQAHGARVVHRADAGQADTFAIATERSGGTIPNQFTDALRDLRVFDNKHIPWLYRVNSRSVRLELLAGILDTDGHLYGNCFDIIQKRRDLAEDIAFVARSLGFAAYVGECQKSCVYKGRVATATYHRLKISGDLSVIPSRVARKTATKRRQIKSVLVTGIQVESAGEGEFYGFELDRDHLFLLGDFTVTHNTSFGAQCPNPVFLQTKGETGLETLIGAGQLPEVPHFPESQTWQHLLGAVDTLTEDEHSYKTLVLDTINGAERMCHEAVCLRDFGGEWGDRGFGGYQRGFEVSLADWRGLLNALDNLRAKRRMTIFCLCHTKVATFKNPEGPDYDRYQPDMNAKTWALTHKWCDGVLFGNFEVTVQTEKGKSKGTGGQQRMLYTERHASFDAKNRLGLAPDIEMGANAPEAWLNFMAAVKEGRQNAAVTNG